jgi:hypothetical protein
MSKAAPKRLAWTSFMIAAGGGNAIGPKDHVAVDEQLCSTVLFQMQYKVTYLMNDGNSLSNMSMCGVVGDGSPPANAHRNTIG